MNIKSLILILLVYFFSSYLFCVSNVFAQTKTSPTPTQKITPSPSLTISPSPTNLEDEKSQEILQKIKDLASQSKDKMEKRAYVGIIRDITSGTIIVTNIRGQQRIITDETTSFISSNKKEIATKDLAIGDKLIALGVSSNEDELNAVRVNVIAPEKNPSPDRQTVIGKVVQVDSAKSSLSFAHEGSNASTITYKIDKNSKYAISPKESLSKINLKSIAINQKAVLVYQEINKVLTVKSLFYLE